MCYILQHQLGTILAVAKIIAKMKGSVYLCHPHYRQTPSQELTMCRYLPPMEINKIGTEPIKRAMIMAANSYNLTRVTRFGYFVAKWLFWGAARHLTPGHLTRSQQLTPGLIGNCVRSQLSWSQMSWSQLSGVKCPKLNVGQPFFGPLNKNVFGLL